MPYLISFGAGLAVGLLYWLVRVHSPAPPLIALAGLLGMVIGEGAVPYVQAHLSHHPAQIKATPAVGEPGSAGGIESHKQI